MTVSEICRTSRGGMIFPFGGEMELQWSDGFRGFLYAVAMIYWFLGVAIVADLFMASIEQVTSRRRKVKGKDGKVRTFKVWNETVATLTLMALGSSAPEIFLSVIDMIKKRFYFGDLGASTIIGSAAFNLLAIIAVCIVVIPSTEVRVIKNLPAFYITAAFSMLAYIWMAFMLSVTSPQIVELWEALLTFLMLPLLVYVSYKTDCGDLDGLLRRARLISPEKEEEEEENPDGVLSFSSEQLPVLGAETDILVEVNVVRRKVSCDPGPVTCEWRTEGASAVSGVDFEAAQGTLEFEPDETQKIMSVRILGRSRRITACEFLIVLSDPDGGPGFDPEEDGGEDEAILTVTIDRHGPEASAFRQAVHSVIDLGTIVLWLEEWRDQVLNTFFVNGSREEQREASKMDWALHLFALPWKVFFALMPPTSILGGWACFYASLGGIALLTTCVSDLAELFGCVLGIADIVTAVSFVALGTSMPDLFASLSAAKEDPIADASIVNVTGSNSVNVFLGLGAPWTIAALFWMINGRTPEWEAAYPEIAGSVSGAVFVVEAKDLGFSVAAFCYVSVLALALLFFRRRWLKCELGGPFVPKVCAFCAFAFFWGLWVGVVSWRVTRQGASPSEIAGVLGGAVGSTMVIVLVTLVVTRRFSIDESVVEDRYSSDPVTKMIEDVGDMPQASAGGSGSTAMTAAEQEFDATFFTAKLEDSEPPAPNGIQIAARCCTAASCADFDDLGEEAPREPLGRSSATPRDRASASVVAKSAS